MSKTRDENNPNCIQLRGESLSYRFGLLMRLQSVCGKLNLRYMMYFGDTTNNNQEMSTSALTCTPGRFGSACALFFGCACIHCAFLLMCFSLIVLFAHFSFRLLCFALIFLFAYCAFRFFVCGGRFKVIISQTWLEAATNSSV